MGRQLYQPINFYKTNLLSDKQYGLHPAGSTADVSTAITHRISEGPDKKFLAWAITLNISRLTRCVIGSCYINSLGKLSELSKSLIIVINGQSPEVYKINIRQGYLLGP